MTSVPRWRGARLRVGRPNRIYSNLTCQYPEETWKKCGKGDSEHSCAWYETVLHSGPQGNRTQKKKQLKGDGWTFPSNLALFGKPGWSSGHSLIRMCVPTSALGPFATHGVGTTSHSHLNQALARHKTKKLRKRTHRHGALASRTEEFIIIMSTPQSQTARSATTEVSTVQCYGHLLAWQLFHPLCHIVRSTLKRER